MRRNRIRSEELKCTWQYVHNKKYCSSSFNIQTAGRLQDVGQCLLDYNLLFKRFNWYYYYNVNETWISIIMLLSTWDFCFFPPITSVHPLPAPDTNAGDLGCARALGPRHAQLVRAPTLDLLAPIALDLCLGRKILACVHGERGREIIP